RQIEFEMARILRRLRTAKAAINDQTSGKRVRPCVSCGSNGSSSASGSFDHSNSCSGDSSASQISSVVSDCQSRANVHGPLCGGHVFEQVVSMYHGSGRFWGCLLSLPAILASP